MSDKKIDWIPLTKWGKHFQYPTYGAMRNICARRKTNGAEVFLSMVNGRFYVNPEKFNVWMEQQQSQSRRGS